MHEHMRRKRQQLTDKECWEVLRSCTHGVLSTIGEDGWPYGVPINYAVHGDSLVFHCAQEGHKLRNLAWSDKACFTVVDRALVIPEGLVTRYRSVICFGTAHSVTDPERKRELLWAFGKAFAAGMDDVLDKAMREEFDITCVIEMHIEEMTGKKNDGELPA